MKNEYIKKSEAIEDIEEPVTMSMCFSVEECEAIRFGQRLSANRVRAIEPEDVMPVVFCKDCKHREYMDNRIPSERDWVCWMFDVTTKDTDFCSFGEKKE